MSKEIFKNITNFIEIYEKSLIKTLIYNSSIFSYNFVLKLKKNK